jgi:hypothetical protein
MDTAELSGQPDMHGLNQRPALLLAHALTLFGGLTANARFNRVERGDPSQGFQEDHQKIGLFHRPAACFGFQGVNGFLGRAIPFGSEHDHPPSTHTRGYGRSAPCGAASLTLAPLAIEAKKAARFSGVLTGLGASGLPCCIIPPLELIKAFPPHGVGRRMRSDIASNDAQSLRSAG